MSVEAPFLRWTEDEILHPQFTKVLKGFDSEEVEAFIADLSRRIQSLEEGLQQAVEERNEARRRYQSVQAEAYRQVAARMADVLRTADGLSEKLRREAEDDARRTVAEAANRAADMRRQAESDAARLRVQGHQALQAAQAHAEEVMTQLRCRRDDMRAQFESVRAQISVLLDQADLAIAAASAKDGPADTEPGPGTLEPGAPDPDRAAPPESGPASEARPAGDPGDDPDDLLVKTEGFDIVVIDDKDLDRPPSDRTDP